MLVACSKKSKRRIEEKFGVLVLVFGDTFDSLLHLLTRCNCGVAVIQVCIRLLSQKLACRLARARKSSASFILRILQMRSSRVLEPARGTVAQVLASARASLKEPLARPFTPAETRQTNGPLDQRPSSAFHNTAEIWTADAASDSHPVTPTCKARRSALSRGRPNKPQDSPVPGGAPSIPRSCPSAVPAWVKEMDELILLLDSEMTQVLRGGSAVGESLGRVRLLLQKLWPNVEGMAGACGDGDER